MFEIFQPIVEPLFRLVQGFNVWRYIASPVYRRNTHERWEHEKPIIIVGNCIGGLILLAITALLIYLFFRFLLLGAS